VFESTCWVAIVNMRLSSCTRREDTRTTEQKKGLESHSFRDVGECRVRNFHPILEILGNYRYMARHASRTMYINSEFDIDVMGLN
jgi:hypothetical protein